ncbi:MAG: ABC transporter ATP-binding protein [Hominenteromicrobium sp.]
MTFYLKKEWKMNLLIVLLQTVYAGLRVAQNVVLIEVFQGIIDLNLKAFLFWMTVNAAAWIVICALDGVRSWAISLAVRFMNNRVRGDMAAAVLKKNHREFHEKQSGAYLSWFTNDVSQIEKLSWNSFYGMVLTAAQIVFSVAVLAYMHWSLLAVSALAAVLIIQAPKLLSKRVEALSEACAAKQAAATDRLKDLLMGLDVLRSFGRTERFIRENREASDQLEQPRYKLAYVQAFIGEGIGMISVVCQMLVLILVGVLSISGIIVQSAVIGCGNLCSTVYNGLAALGQYRLAIQAGKPYFEQITHQAGGEAKENRQGCAPVREAITVEGVSFRYGGKAVLRDVSFRFEKGGKYALTGPSGCGKSTLLKLLLGWLPEYTGSIRFDGRNARAFTSEQLQEQMSYIEQDVFLFNTTIRENITLGMNFPDKRLERAVRDSALDRDLASMPLGLDTPVGENGSNLSGGQKQRVAIARALIHRHSILLVDEGTSALDQQNADIVEQSLLQNPDLTLILVSHHLTPERQAQFTKVYHLEPVIDPV